MSNGIETPPPAGGMGCFGKGCTAFIGLLVFLAIALIAGTFWGVHYLRSYSATEPLPLPKAETAPSVAPMRAEEPTVLPSAAPATPIPAEEIKAVARDWKTFEDAGKRHEAVMIELTASDINMLIAGSNARGKVYVVIDNNIARVQLSIPLKGVFMMEGRYLNGTLDVEASPDGDLLKARIYHMTMNGRSVPDNIIDQGMFGWPSLRSMVAKWLGDRSISSFKIENDRVIGETGGGR